MPTPESIIAAAQAIRSELPALLPPETAAEYDRQILTLLTQIAANQAQPTQLSQLLRQSEPTRQWMQRYLQGEAPAEITRSISYSGMAGDPALQPAPKYVCPHSDCPHNDTPWYREDNSPIPLCETHLIPLILAQP